MIRMRMSEAAEMLQARRDGEDVAFEGCSTDTRTLSEGEMFIALRGEHFDGHDFLERAQSGGAVAAMVDCTRDRNTLPVIHVSDTRKAMGDLAEGWRKRFTLPLIAVTGSNGKTTVKEMLASILSQEAAVLATRGNLNNDIGVPLTLFGLDENHRYAVIEMGANHPGEIAGLSAISAPTVALITLCAPAHIEGFGSVEGVARAKAEIFSGLRPGGTAVINADDSYADYWRGAAAAHARLSFGIENEADVSLHGLQLDQDSGRSVFTLTTPAGETDIELNLLGLHNVRNALAAAACCTAIDIPLQRIRLGLQRARPVRGRLEIRQGIRGCRLLDDTYNANPASLEAAIHAAVAGGHRCWLVLGDMGELGDEAVARHRDAGELARREGIERLYGFGPLSRHAATAFGEGARHYDDREQLLAELTAEVEEGLILLVKGSRAMAMERVINELLEGT